MRALQRVIVLIMSLLVLTVNGHAQSPREQLNQLVGQLQANPSDAALRERIIKLAQTIKPALAVPEEAERRMARGSAAFKSAKSESDFKDAVREFEQASIAAPWSGDIYYNLGVTQDKAGDFASAIRSLKLAMLAAPDSRDTKTLLYEVEYRQEKANSPEVQAAKRQADEQGIVRSLNGTSFGIEINNGESTTIGKVDVANGIATFASYFVWTRNRERVDYAPMFTGTCRLDQLKCVATGAQNGQPNGQTMNFEFAPDGGHVVVSPAPMFGQSATFRRR